MKLTITIQLDDAAFEDNPGELQKVLSQVEIYEDGLVRTLRDSNGNTIGRYVVSQED